MHIILIWESKYFIILFIIILLDILLKICVTSREEYNTTNAADSGQFKLNNEKKILPLDNK